MISRYNTLDHVAHLTVPMLIAHSPGDELVPFEMGRRLFAAAASPKQFVALTGGHNDGLWTPDYEQALRELIAQGRADAFFTCGSNRLMQLMKRLGREHGIPGQMAMEQIMACGLGPCYICVRTFERDGQRERRRVCVEGPVFDLQECLGW